MLKIQPTSRFKKDLKKYRFKKRELAAFEQVLVLIIGGEPLPISCALHPLTGKWKGSMDCHVLPDFLLIFRIDANKGLVHLERIGSHAELFNM